MHDVRCVMCTAFFEDEGVVTFTLKVKELPTVLQNAECDASDGSCLNTTLYCLSTCSNVRICIGRPQQMKANQASSCAAEGLQIRGFARQAASIASTRQSNQKRNPRSVATMVTNESELISLAMPPLLH